MSTPTTTSRPLPPPDSSPRTAPPQMTGPRWSRRWRRRRPEVITVALTLIPVLMTMWAWIITFTAPLAIDNPKGWGTMASTELLRDERISVNKADSLSQTVDTGREGATITVINADRLSNQDRRTLAEPGGGVTVIGVEGGGDALAGLTGTIAKGTAAAASSTRTPQYDDADAQVARSLAGTCALVSLQGDGDTAGYFPVGEDRYAYATDSLPSGATLWILSDPVPVINVHLT